MANLLKTTNGSLYPKWPSLDLLKAMEEDHCPSLRIRSFAAGSTCQVGNSNNDKGGLEEHEKAVWVIEDEQLVNDTSSNSKTDSTKPKRPLSAYNLFYKFDRERLIHGQPDLPVTAAMLRRLSQQDKCKPIKRIHRRTHGKISFVELSKAISARWRALPEASKQVFEAQSALEKEEYDIKNKTWKQQQQQMRQKQQLQRQQANRNNNRARENELQKDDEQEEHRDILLQQHIKFELNNSSSNRTSNDERLTFPKTVICSKSTTAGPNHRPSSFKCQRCHLETAKEFYCASCETALRQLAAIQDQSWSFLKVQQSQQKQLFRTEECKGEEDPQSNHHNNDPVPINSPGGSSSTMSAIGFTCSAPLAWDDMENLFED